MNKEENPLRLAVAFSFGKQGGLTMCFTFNSCSELFNAICKYFNFGC